MEQARLEALQPKALQLDVQPIGVSMYGVAQRSALAASVGCEGLTVNAGTWAQEGDEAEGWEPHVKEPVGDRMLSSQWGTAVAAFYDGSDIGGELAVHEEHFSMARARPALPPPPAAESKVSVAARQLVEAMQNRSAHAHARAQVRMHACRHTRARPQTPHTQTHADACTHTQTYGAYRF